jgi:hypothetical protein
MFSWDPRLYYLIDVFYYILVGSILGRAHSALKIKLFPGVQEKIDADNNKEFFVSVSGILGYGIAMFVELPVVWCLSLFLAADWIRTATFLYVINKEKDLIFAVREASIEDADGKKERKNDKIEVCDRQQGFA